jgi:hypothetical protein
MFLLIEAGLCVLALVLAFTVPNLGSRWFEAIERSFGKLAKRRGLSVLVVGLTALALRAALLPILPIPQPGIQDEFCYLLLSDTFAHGRLTNPTHPMWVHFESPFILWHPTYTAKYWPAQGLIMALGQVGTGQPFWGVWLSVGLMCAAITWMLQAWVGEGWALLGGFLTIIRFGTFNYWANSYWGGAVAATGGALVLGALPRIKQDRRVRDALLMGLGFAILGNSRPYEGLFFGMPVAVAMLLWLWRMKRADLIQALKRVMVPLLTVLALTLVAMGYYFWRTTGSPWSPPYFVYERTFNPVPYFPWLRVRKMPTALSPELRLYFQHFENTAYNSTETAEGLVKNLLVKFVLVWAFYLGPVLTLPLVLLPTVMPVGYSWKDISSSTRFLVTVGGAVILANLLLIGYEPHYSAPTTCVIVALVVIAMRRLRSLQRQGQRTGNFVVRAVPSACLILLALRVVTGHAATFAQSHGSGKSVPTWCWQSPSNPVRTAVFESIRKYFKGQLVIVHYNLDDYATGYEWVYNGADIDSQKVIWAHDMGPAENEELIRYYKDRRVWLLYADDQPPKLVPYSEAADREANARTNLSKPNPVSGR